MDGTWKRSVTIFVCIFLTGTSAGALEKSKDSDEVIYDLGLIRVGGGRLDLLSDGLSLMKSTRSVDVLDGQELSQSVSLSLPETLSAHPSVTYTDDLGQGLAARVDLRGFGGEAKQALVLFDGLRAVEPFDNSVVWNLYPVEYLESVEILPGAGSSVYGEGALSGVISMKTKEPTKDRHVNVETAFGSYALQRFFAETSGTTPGGLGLWVGGRYFETDGYRQNSDHESVTTLLKATYALTELLRVENAFYFADSETGIAGPLSPQEALQNPRQKDPDGQFGDKFTDNLIQNGLRLDYHAEPIDVQVSDHLGYRLRDQDSIQTFGGSFPGTSINKIGTETFSNVLQGVRSWGEAENRDTLFAGFEWSIDDIHNPSSFEDVTFGPFESEKSIDREVWGFFLQNRAEFWNAWVVEGGLRYDKIHWNIYDLRAPQLEKNKKTDALSPQVSVSWSPWVNWTVFGGYSESFKAPDSNALIFETPNLFLPNPNVDASVAHQTEFGSRFKPYNGMLLQITLFHIETKKEILFNDISNLNENFDTLREGLESSAEIQLNSAWSAFLGCAFTDAEFDGGVFDAKKIPLVPESRGFAGLTWLGPQGWRVSVQVEGVLNRFALNDFNNIFPAEDYWTADLGLAKSLPNGEVFLKIRNLFDQRFSTFTTSNAVDTVNVNPSPGFNLEAGVRFEV
jgi:outer membrane receptor protein involved in Fe transport